MDRWGGGHNARQSWQTSLISYICDRLTSELAGTKRIIFKPLGGSVPITEARNKTSGLCFIGACEPGRVPTGRRGPARVGLESGSSRARDGLSARLGRPTEGSRPSQSARASCQAPLVQWRKPRSEEGTGTCRIRNLKHESKDNNLSRGT